jgi:hypothetical protein
MHGRKPNVSQLAVPQRLVLPREGAWRAEAKTHIKFRRRPDDIVSVGARRVSWRRARWLLGSLLGLSSTGCGVFFGDPVELFPSEQDAGLADESPCIEQATQMSGNGETVIDVPARALAALVELGADKELDWPGNIRTHIKVGLSDAKVYSVTSRINQRVRQRLEQDQCTDYVRIDARVTLKTDDGKLDETVDKISFFAFDGTEAKAVFAIDADALHGSYKPLALATRCFERTTFRLLAALDGSHGAMIDELHGGSCDDPDDGALINLASGHWGDRWKH